MIIFSAVKEYLFACWNSFSNLGAILLCSWPLRSSVNGNAHPTYLSVEMYIHLPTLTPQQTRRIHLVVPRRPFANRSKVGPFSPFRA